MKRLLAAVAVVVLLAGYLAGAGAENAREASPEARPANAEGKTAAKPAPSGLDPSLGGGKAPLPTTGRFRVFILSGQSNMVGQGEAKELTEVYRKPHDRIRIWCEGGWQYLVPSRRFGPEVGMAHELAKAWPDDTIGIIKVAIGGTGILAFVPDWSREQADRTGDGWKGPIYKTIIRCYQAAKQAGGIELAGFVWKQGGKDAKSLDTAKEYLANLEKLVAGVRKDTGAADLPVFISTYMTREELDKAAEDPSTKALAQGRPGLVDVLKAQLDAPQKIPNVFTVVHGRLPLKPDGIHFNTEGQLTQGKLIADAVVKYYKEKGAGAAAE